MREYFNSSVAVKPDFRFRMRPDKRSHAATPQVKHDGRSPWQILLWLVFPIHSLFFLPQCLDRSLAPRFLFLSFVLLAGFFLVWNELRRKADWRLHFFDLLLLAWYGLNLASVTWAFSWSEAVFYTQKVLLLLLTYWLVRQALYLNALAVRRTLRQATTLLSFVVCGILSVQLGLAAMRYGLDNEKLYNLDWFFFGNKSLTSEFLFFLLVFNVLFAKKGDSKDDAESIGWYKPYVSWLVVSWLVLLIVLLQTRTVYLALAAGMLLYVPVRCWLEPDFFRLFKKKILPAGLLAVGLFLAFLALKGNTSSLAERLNPVNYLESGTANERRFVWYKTGLLNADHFWLGVGNGSWKLWFPSKSIEGAYRLQEQNVVFTRVHNDYLEVRAEMGIVGLALFCLLFGAAFLAALRGIRKPATNAPDRHDLLVLAVGLLGYGIVQSLDFPRERIEMQVILAILFAFAAFYTQELWARLPGICMRKAKWAVAVLVVAGLLFNLVIGWNRVAGEIHALRMVRQQTKHNHKEVIAEARAAENAFYEYNDVVVPFAWYEGVSYYQMNQTDQAVPAFERAYRLNPWSFQVINNYASALVKNGQFREAIPYYEKALEINPRYEDGKFNLAYTWFQAGDKAMALEWLERVDTIPNPQTEEQRRKNDLIKKQQASFRESIGTQ